MNGNEQSPVEVQRLGHTMLITLCRPDVRNAVNLAVHLAIGEALEEAERDRHIRVVVITGSGDQAFCAGADLRALARGEALLPDDARRRRWGFAGYTAHPISKPTIAAVNGAALGGGCEIVIASDIAIASETAILGLTEVRRGIIAAGGGAFRLPRQIPPKLAFELLYTGQTITAQRAWDLGLINRVVPPAKLIDTALAIAERIGSNAPLAVQATKRIATGTARGETLAEAADWTRSYDEFSAILSTRDAVEGPLAFAEKREPVWEGR